MRRTLVIAGILPLIAGLPMVSGNYLLRLGTILAMYVVLAHSWNFIGGFAGYPSFGTAAFFGAGAYVSAVLQSRGVPLALAWSAAAFAASVLAALIGAAILHLRGHYFAVASLVVAEVLREIVNTAPALTGGGMGLNLPIPRVSVEIQARLFFYAMWGLATLCLVTALAVHQSKLGFGLRCIQQNEDAASVLGVNTYAYKIGAFALSAVFVGVSGAIYASWVHYIEPPDVFDVLLSVKPLVMVLLGGLGTVFGPVIGAVILLSLEELVWRHFLTVHSGVLGLLIAVLVLFMPEGILARLSRRRSLGRAGT